jgi:hypothetical protein
VFSVTLWWVFVQSLITTEPHRTQRLNIEKLKLGH